MYKGIIFDFDGVIVDSEVKYVESLVAYLDTIDIDCAFDDVSYVIGQSMPDIYACIKKQFDLKISEDVFIKDSLEVYEKMCDISAFEPMAGLIEFLEKCQEKGIRMAVASSSGYEYLYTIMDSFGIRKYFELVFSGDELEHSKPDPEIYDLTAKKMDLDKKELMIIEDSVNGIKAAKASGIFCIGFKGSKIFQDTSLADKEVKSFKEIINILEQ